MRPTRSMISFLLLAAILVPLTAQPSRIASVDEYVVEEGDSMYWISRTVYSEAEKLDGAHWLSMFDYNVEQGRVNPVRTPIQLGPKGLFLHIEPGQKLLIPHYSGLFPSPGAIALRYGVHDESGAPLAGFIPDFPPLPARSAREPHGLDSIVVEPASVETIAVESADIESVVSAVSIPAVDAVGDEHPAVFVIPGKVRPRRSSPRFWQPSLPRRARKPGSNHTRKLWRKPVLK